MFASIRIKESKMNLSAINSALSTSQMMGSRITMMYCMPMIMRRPSCGVMNHIV